MRRMKSVYIARHGMTLWNKEGRIQGQTNDIPLSPEGKKQMERLGIFLQQTIHNPIVLVSPLIRARESFEVINSYLQVSNDDVYVIPELIEMNFGKFEGLLKRDIQSDNFFIERKQNKYTTPYPEGESYKDVQKRLLKSRIKDIFENAKQNGRDILFVGHESTNRMIPVVLGIGEMSEQKAVENRQKNNEIVIYNDPFNERIIQIF